MFLSKLRQNMGIKRKIFIGSTCIIIIGFIFLYLSIYLFMPEMYKRYKESSVKTNVDDLINELSSKSNSDVDTIIDKFAFSNNLNIMIENSSGKIIYSSFREGFIDNKISHKMQEDNNLDIHNAKDIENAKDNHQINDIENNKPEQRGFTNNGMVGPRGHNIEFAGNSGNDLTIKKSFYFLSKKEKCTITVRTVIQVKDETKNLIIVFFPVAIATIIVIAITIAYFYARIISKPLIAMNKKAKKMSNLDFSERFHPTGSDEISQLSTSLNIMCDNLEDNIEQLEMANIKLQQDIEKEREMQKERKEFIATISHELKSPITIIAGQLEGMIYNIGKYGDRNKYLAETLDVTRNMENLVLEILELSRLDTKNFEMGIEEVELSNILKNIVKENYYFIEEKGLKLNLDILDNVIIQGDRKLLKKALTNVIRNGIQHSPKGEKINILLNKNQLIVKNTGVSIDEKELKNIFEAFYRVDKSRNSNTGGTGLGLYIVKSIFDKHENMQYSIKSTDNSVIFDVKFV